MKRSANPERANCKGISMFGILAVALSLTVQGNTASAQRPADPDEIVVEGVRDPAREVEQFVSALTEAPIRGQISRFDWAVCPAAVGLPDAQNAAIVDRMRRVATAAGIKTAPAPCQPNALVLVTSDKREMIERLHESYPDYFEGHTRDDVAGLARQPGPAAAWHVEGRLDRNGVPLARDGLTGQYKLESSDTPSRLTPNSRPHFVASVVVVELDALAGLTPTQLADYAAMRAFARSDPERLKNSAAPTILSILDAPIGSAVPITMTEWDLGFLKALYSSKENRYASQQRGEIRSRLKDEMLKGED